MATLGNLIREQAFLLKGPCAYLEAELLTAHALGYDRVQIYTHWDREVDTLSQKKIQKLIQKRKQGLSVAHILRQKEFYGRGFYVPPGVFVPRPETETLIEAFQNTKALGNKKNLKLADFGCGSGSVGLTLKALCPGLFLLSLDLCEKALKATRKNAKNLGLQKESWFLKKDVSLLKFPALPVAFRSGLDAVVANPPYVAWDDKDLQAEVKKFEPPRALFSEEGGLYHIRMWFQKAEELLKPGGHYFFEVGARQDVSFLKKKNPLMHFVSSYKDLMGYQRIMHFQKSYG